MFATLLAAALMAPSALQEPVSLTPASARVQQPVELGQVRWRRDFDAGLAEAGKLNKPALVLFQEVPG